MSQGSYKKEWTGVGGYCNCLLVTMCRTGSSKLALETGKPVPNLESLAQHISSTREWLLRQQFPYEQIDPGQVIDCFAKSCRIKKGLLGYPKSAVSQMTIIDVVEDDGPTVERQFQFQLNRNGRSLSLEITLLPGSQELTGH